MDNVDLCLNEVYNTIPCEILSAVFIDSELSVREKLKLEVWDKIVLMDLDAYGGEKITVRLDDLPYKAEYVNGEQYRTYHIPRSCTRDKIITSVLNIIHTPWIAVQGYTSLYGSLANNSLPISAAQKAFNVYQAPNIANIIDIKLIGLNLITAHFPPIVYGPDSFKMDCIVQNDVTLNNFDIKMMNNIVNLFVIATKRYIYNKLVIKTDIGATLNGYEIGAFKDVVDSYSDAWEQYEEAKKKIGIYSLLGNAKSRLELFRSINQVR